MRWEIATSANVTVLLPSILVLNMKSECRAQKGDTYTEIRWFESLSSAQVRSLAFGSQKFRFEICCLFYAEINFPYLYGPLKIQMLVLGAYYPKFQTNQLSLVLPLSMFGCSTLHCAELFIQCLQWWQNLFLCLDHFWAQAPWKQVKSTSVSWSDLWLGWQVELRLKTFLQTEAFLELMSFSSAIRLTTAYSLKLLFANRLILLDAADCCEIQRWFCQFLEKTDISVCHPFISGSLSWCETV